MVRVMKSPYLNTPQPLDVDRSKVYPLVRNLFHDKARQAPLAGRREPRGKVTNKFRNEENVEERYNSAGEIRTWGISE